MQNAFQFRFVVSAMAAAATLLAGSRLIGSPLGWRRQGIRDHIVGVIRVRWHLGKGSGADEERDACSSRELKEMTHFIPPKEFFFSRDDPGAQTLAVDWC